MKVNTGKQSTTKSRVNFGKQVNAVIQFWAKGYPWRKKTRDKPLSIYGMLNSNFRRASKGIIHL